MLQTTPRPVVLSIAGFDPSGGAGIIADVTTFASFGCQPTAAVTSLTFQNAEGVFGAIHESAESLRAQILPIVAEFSLAAVKIGMLPTAEIVHEVARLLREFKLPAPVIDPVIESTSGDRLMEENAIGVLLTDLLPLSRVVTPNIPEAERLSGLKIDDEEGMREAAKRIRQLGARAVLVKGGHLREQRAEGRRQKTSSSEVIDVLDDEGVMTVLRAKRIIAAELHGSGCLLSAGIAAGLAKGLTLENSIREAKFFVTDALRVVRKQSPQP